jgi:hypothetical protein
MEYPPERNQRTRVHGRRHHVLEHGVWDHTFSRVEEEMLGRELCATSLQFRSDKLWIRLVVDIPLLAGLELLDSRER